jgi:DNA polymerase-1
MVKKYKNTYILLDAHAIIHRAYHALPDFSTKDGRPTGALYGVFNMILKVISDFKPDYLVACFDLPQKTFRHIAYEDYKGTRKKADSNLIEQIKDSRRIFEAFGIQTFDAPGFEADDILGTLVSILKKDKNNQIIIASGDMDTMQLIDKDQVLVYTLKKGINDTFLYNEKSIVDRYGFLPQYITDYKGLRGDASDNIPGVSGIGEKTATNLITSFKTVENIYKELKKDSNKFKEKSGLSDRLIQILKDSEDEALFSKELATIRTDAPVLDINLIKKYNDNFNLDLLISICKEFEFNSLIKRLQYTYKSDTDFNTNDVLTKSINTTIDKKYFLALSLLDSENTKPTEDDFFYFSKEKNYEEAKQNIEERLKKEELYDLWNNIEVPLLPYVENMSEVGILLDLKYLSSLSSKYHKELDLLENKIIELSGISFNINSPKQLSDVLFNKLHIQNISESKINLKKMADGSFSTKESELEKLRDDHEIISLILDYRELQKLLGTYIDVLGKLVSEDFRLHSNFNQLGTSTGRFASSDPNLQNIPIKTDKGKAIRKAFISKDGYSLLSFDYSQIELRVAALMSQDEFLLNTFIKNEDVHTSVAMQVFQVDEENVTSEMRRKAKVINFGIIYGMGSQSLSQNLKVSYKEAKVFIEEYKKRIPGLNNYLDSVLESAKRDKFTRTFFGRKRYFSKINSSIPFIRSMYERMAINAPIQGTAADIIKLAIINIEREIDKQCLKDRVKLVLQIHDEIVFEVKDEDVPYVKDFIYNEMISVLINSVKDKNLILPPLEVHVSVSKNLEDK